MYDKLEMNITQPDVTIRKNLFKEIEEQDRIINLVLIATKPDIIKQAPLILELKKRGDYVLVGHTGQHRDWNLSGSLEKEFGINPDFNLNISGPMYEKQSQIIHRLGTILDRIKKMKKRVIPYTHGDTMTAFAGGIAAYMNQYPVGHVEAGLRSLTPEKELMLSMLEDFDVEKIYEDFKSCEWHRGSLEPYPEQFDTRATAPASAIHFAPVRLNKESLKNEGYPEERIFVTGNTVSDAVDFAEKHVKQSKIFEEYPMLENGDAIRFCIHRRDNLISFHRFKVLFEAMERLVKEGRNILFISLGGTEHALAEFGFKKRVEKLSEEHKSNFIYSPVWPFYTDVIAAMKKCSVIATDSGSIQEEGNILGVPTVTLRFNSDRPETIFNGSNIIAPPIKPEIVVKIIQEVADNTHLNKRMRSVGNLYGKNVCSKICRKVEEVSANENFFRMEHERLGFTKLNFWEKGELDW